MSTPAATSVAPDLSFPVGQFSRPSEYTPELRRESIAAVAALPENLRAAVSGLNDAKLDTPYREGGWTVRQLVHHVADSHMNSYVRFKLALTEDWPTIKPYDQDLWAELADSKLPVEPSLQIIAGLHQRWVALIKSLSDDDLQRGFVHPEHGSRQTLDFALAIYAWHSRHHTGHITELRKRMGW